MRFTRLLLPHSSTLYAHDFTNNHFIVDQGKSVVVPVRTFPQRNTGKHFFELFDTLNFKVRTPTLGSFTVEPVKNKGIQSTSLKLYAKEVLASNT